jgi:hypothetical protein
MADHISFQFPSAEHAAEFLYNVVYNGQRRGTVVQVFEGLAGYDNTRKWALLYGGHEMTSDEAQPRREAQLKRKIAKLESQLRPRQKKT